MNLPTMILFCAEYIEIYAGAYLSSALSQWLYYSLFCSQNATPNRIQDFIRHSAFVERWRKVISVVFRVSQIICLESLVGSLSAASSRRVMVEG